ncbi:MAG TPA: EF-hand domain-containing protein [Chthoniobacter sp.]|nr:EF-hand domain-containing protein [Chthoniobacter sp.]
MDKSSVSIVSIALPLLVCAALCSLSANAQDAKPRPRGGFDRPLADTPRFGNPGASPKLTIVDFGALLAHWAEFDADKNQRLEKSEVPELFGKLFDEADLNHDGVLDEQERGLVMQAASASSPASAATTAK